MNKQSYLPDPSDTPDIAQEKAFHATLQEFPPEDRLTIATMLLTMEIEDLIEGLPNQLRTVDRIFRMMAVRLLEPYETNEEGKPE